MSKKPCPCDVSVHGHGLMIVEIQEALQKRELSLQIDSNLYTLRRIPTSPCKETCPIDTDVKSYLGLIVAGKFDKALEVIKKDNPLPGICGRVCTHPCEAECTRQEVDEPLSICALKRFLADYELKNQGIGCREQGKKPKVVSPTREEKIAIIGSGPAGLTAANDLVRLGYGVTIFEELPVAGGMLTVGIPAYRLPREIIKAEIDAIKEFGVKIRLNTKVTDLTKLRRQGFKAIFIAVGAHKGLKLGIPGEDEYEGFIDCITFLRAVNLCEKVKIGKKVIVIGGGNAAIDAARTALRLGSDVHIVYRRTKKEMPANPWEIDEAEKEGVKIHYLASPVKIIGKKGKVVVMECIRNELGAPDESGRRRPVPIAGSEFKIDVDTVIPAISQEPDLSWLPERHGLKISKWNSFVVNEETLETNLPGIFAGGDCVTGPKIVIAAIAAGHRAAKSIESYLSGDEVHTLRPVKEAELVIKHEGGTKRVEPPKLPLEKRKGFDEVELGLTEEMATCEAKRCIRCGPCFECLECINECAKRLLSLSIQGEPYGMLVRTLLGLFNQEVSGNILVGSQKLSVTLEPITAKVNDELCRGCGDCEKICEYEAPKLYDKGKGVFASVIDATKCRGCGVCSSICSSRAIEMNHFSDERLEPFVQEVLR